MISNAHCDACLLGKRLNDIPAGAEPDKIAAYQRRVHEIIGGHPEWSSPEKDYAINRAREAVFGQVKDFAPIKAHFNALLMELLPMMLSGIHAADDPLRRAVQYAMTGNFIDFAVLGSVDEDKLSALIAESDRIPIEDGILEALRSEVKNARTLAYIADNCGEIVMDRVLMQAMREINPGLAITAVVKGAPIVNDATREDAEQVRLHEVAQHIADTGCGIAGCPENRMSAECVRTLDAADVIIAKGQANYETLCDCGRNIFYIFMCKCDLFMERFNAPQFSGIICREPLQTNA